MQTVKGVLTNRIAIAALSAVASVLGTAMATHYPSIYAAVCVAGGGL